MCFGCDGSDNNREHGRHINIYIEHGIDERLTVWRLMRNADGIEGSVCVCVFVCLRGEGVEGMGQGSSFSEGTTNKMGRLTSNGSAGQLSLLIGGGARWEGDGRSSSSSLSSFGGCLL